MRERQVTGAAALLRYVALPAALLRPPAHRRLAVLAFHSVRGNSGSDFDLSPDEFRRRFHLIAEFAEIIALADAWSHERQRGSLIALTFDDAYLDFYDLAFPALEAARVPSTLYVAPEMIGRSTGLRGLTNATCSWTQIRELADSGLVTIGSHGLSHRSFLTFDEREAKQELARSRAILEDRTGREVRDFAWPFGHYSATLVGWAGELFDRVAGFHGGLADLGRPCPRTIPRIPVRRSDGVAWFIRKLSGIGSADEGLRFFIKRVRGY